MLLKYPELYRYGQKSKSFNVRSFWVWIADSLFHSLVIYFFCVGFFGEDYTLADGTEAGLWFQSTLIYTMVIVVVTFKAILITDTWTLYSLIATYGSMLAWFAFVPLYVAIGPSIGVGEGTCYS